MVHLNYRVNFVPFSWTKRGQQGPRQRPASTTVVGLLSVILILLLIFMNGNNIVAHLSLKLLQKPMLHIHICTTVIVAIVWITTNVGT